MPNRHELAIEQSRSVLARQSPEQTLRWVAQTLLRRTADDPDLRDYVVAMRFSQRNDLVNARLSAEAFRFDRTQAGSPYARVPEHVLAALAVHVASEAFYRIARSREGSYTVRPGESVEILLALLDSARILNSLTTRTESEEQFLSALTTAGFNVSAKLRGEFRFTCGEHNVRIDAQALRSQTNVLRTQAFFEAARDLGMLGAMQHLRASGVLGDDPTNPFRFQEPQRDILGLTNAKEILNQAATELSARAWQWETGNIAQAHDIRAAFDACAQIFFAMDGVESNGSTLLVRQRPGSEREASLLYCDVCLRAAYATMAQAAREGLSTYRDTFAIIHEIMRALAACSVPKRTYGVENAAELASGLQRAGFENARSDLEAYFAKVAEGERTTLRLLAQRFIRDATTPLHRTASALDLNTAITDIAGNRFFRNEFLSERGASYSAYRYGYHGKHLQIAAEAESVVTELMSSLTENERAQLHSAADACKAISPALKVLHDRIQRPAAPCGRDMELGP